MPNEGGTWVMYGVSEENPCCVHIVEQLMDLFWEVKKEGAFLGL